jgi:hypothetical protein
MSAAGGSDLFESYEQDLNQLTQSITQKLTVSVPAQSGGTGGENCPSLLNPGNFAACLTLKLFLYSSTYYLEERKVTLRAVDRELEEADEIVCHC